MPIVSTSLTTDPILLTRHLGRKLKRYGTTPDETILSWTTKLYFCAAGNYSFVSNTTEGLN